MYDLLACFAMKITARLSEKLLAETVVIAEFYILPVADKTHLSQIALFLSEHLPLNDELKLFLKRVSFQKDIGSACVLICQKTKFASASDVGSFLSVKLNDLIKDNLANIYEAPVPVERPLTRRQFNFCKQFWPVAFHESRMVEALLSDQYFQPAERDRIEELCRKLLDRWRLSGALNMGVVRDPAGCLRGDFVPDRREQHVLRHAAMETIEALASQKRQSVAMATVASDGTNDEDYLLSGMDYFTVREPCAMCAGALIHSRVWRVFYMETDAMRGALGSQLQMHVLPQLNHRFEVFHVQLSEQLPSAPP